MIPTPPTITETEAAMMKTTMRPAEIARAQFANRQSQWQPLAEETVAQQQATADFYLANGLIRTRLDVKPTFDRRFSVPAAEVTP